MNARAGKVSYNDYKRAMLRRFIAYRRQHFPLEDDLFDPRRDHVFRADFAFCNLFEHRLDHLLPHSRRHRWFASMGSSQALAVSVFGTILERREFGLLNEVPDEHGHPLLPDFVAAGEPEFDYKVTTLHEPRPTQVDLFLPGQHGHVAVECKLWEDRLSPCSQVPEKCNGSYASQPGRASGQRCILTEKRVAYWQHIPELFRWRANEDYSTCPIWRPYQLVRNVLAAAVDPGRGKVWDHSVTVLVYDANNPTCAPGGRIDEQYRIVEAALQGPAMLKRTTWQTIVRVLLENGGYRELLEWLEAKYGISAD